MPEPKRVTAVFFDLGGTLFHHLPSTHTSENLLRVVRELSGAAEHTDAHIVATYRTMRRLVESEALTSAFYMHRRLVADAFMRTLRALNLRGNHLTTEFCDGQALAVTEHLQLRDDARSTLRALRSAGIYTAIVSNIDDNYIEPLLRSHALHELFDHCLSSQQARSCKPHTQIFSHALNASGHAPANVLFVGDSYHHDVVGAQRMGMMAAWLTVDDPQPQQLQEDFQIQSLSELPGLVDGERLHEA